jgi:hypothetical protein
MVQAQRNALDGALVAQPDREALRALGFTTAAVAPSGGILKGTAAVVLPRRAAATTPVRVVRNPAYATASLQTSREGYPDSEMGACALLRQMLLDGQWYERCQRALAADASLAAKAPPPSPVLQALVDQKTLPLWFDVQDELQALRRLEESRPSSNGRPSCSAAAWSSAVSRRWPRPRRESWCRCTSPTRPTSRRGGSGPRVAAPAAVVGTGPHEQQAVARRRVVPIAWTTARAAREEGFAAEGARAMALPASRPNRRLAAVDHGARGVRWLPDVAGRTCGTIGPASSRKTPRRDRPVVPVRRVKSEVRRTSGVARAIATLVGEAKDRGPRRHLDRGRDGWARRSARRVPADVHVRRRQGHVARRRGRKLDVAGASRARRRR